MVHIRPFRPDDAEALAELFFAAVNQIGAAHYRPDQLRVWAARVPDPQAYAARAEDGRLLLVAADEADRPVAYGDLEVDGHIDHLYCRPDAAGTGVTAALYRALETAAIERGLRNLHVEASEPARRFFLRQGFSTVERQDFTLNGVPIHNFRMAKALEEGGNHET